MDGRAAAKARTAALETARAFPEGRVPPLVGIEAAFHQEAIRVTHVPRAAIADHAHQSLRQDAVERRNEIVGLDAHIQEAAQHVEDVVGVHRGEHQVSGQGGIDGDLRGLLIADLAHHDLVRVVAQNGPQPARERETLLLIHRDLRDALDLVLHRVLDGDDFVLVVLDFAQRGVERGGLARPGGAGHQHHAVRLHDVAPKFHQVAFGEPHHVERQLGELLAHRFLVEHAQHGVLAVDGGHDGNAEIDQAVLVAHAEAPVLRHALLGDIQFAHHLDARNDGGLPVLGDGRHGVVQHAIDAVLDGHFLIARFNVNIARAPLQGIEDGGIHQLDHRSDVAIGSRELVDGKRLVGIAVFGHHVERESLGDFLQHALRLFGLLQQLGNLREGGHLDEQLAVQQQGKLVDEVQVPRIGQRDLQRAVADLHGHEVVAEHQVHRDGAEQVVIDGRFPQIHVFAPVALRHGARLLRFGGGVGEPRSIDSRHTSPNGIGQREYWQIQGNQHEGHETTHEDHDGRLDQREGGRHAGIHVVLEKLRHAVQHGRQRAGGFAHLDHVDGQAGEQFRGFEGGRKSLAFAHALTGALHRPPEQRRAERIGRGLHGLNQRDAARQQRGQDAR